MKFRRLTAIVLGTFAIATASLGCANIHVKASWATLIDGPNGLENWNRIGDANWRSEDGAIIADKAKEVNYLVSKNSYSDFKIIAEFWADHTTNSGIFLRLSDPKKVTSANSYEVNIYDQCPDPANGTGAIVDVAKVVPMPKAGGKWNTYVITAKGNRFKVELNGVQTVDVRDSKFTAGPIALQFGRGPNGAPGGIIKWRKLLISPL